MTRQQRRALLCLQAAQDRGWSVRLEDISRGIGLQSRSSAHRLMRALVDQGYVAHVAGRKYGYEVVRRIEPIIEYYVWDEAQGRMVEDRCPDRFRNGLRRLA